MKKLATLILILLNITLINDMEWLMVNNCFLANAEFLFQIPNLCEANKNQTLLYSDKMPSGKDAEIVFDDASQTYIVKQNGKYGFLDSDLKWIAVPQFDFAYEFGKDEIAEVMINGFWGYINLDGMYIFEPSFKSPGWGYEKFDENGVAVVIKDGLYAYIRSKGTYLFEPQFEDAEVFVDGIARIKGSNGKYGYILLNGTYLCEPQFDDASQFFIEKAWVQLNGKYGVIDEKAQYLIDTVFDDYSEFTDEVALVEYKGLWGLINYRGEYLLPPTYPDLVDVRGNVCVVGIVVNDSKQYGLIDCYGRVLLNTVFDSIEIDDSGSVITAKFAREVFSNIGEGV